MGCEVYANGDEIACKAGDGKVIAAFPDVCLTPPSPPAGPIPVPYPNTSFSKDMKKGSKTVMIKGKEVMLKDQSFYKTSPLGDEAATKSLGAGVITHVITGKTYFVAWSMDVKFEGKNVDRHSDSTTSNHASPIGNASAPFPNMSTLAKSMLDQDICPCCHEPAHSKGEAVNMDTFYTTDNNGAPKPALKKEYDAVMKRVANKKSAGCVCSGKVLPEPPCNVFYNKTTEAERNKIKKKWNKQGRKGDGPGTIRKKLGAKAGEQVNHLVPKCAGGCPAGKGNLQAHEKLCAVCQKIDGDFGKLQSKASDTT